MILVVMGVFVVLSVAKLLHEFGWGIPEVQGYRLVSCLPYALEGCIDAHIGRIALGACG